MNRLCLTATLLGLAALPGCAAPAYVSPVEVTRFVGHAPASLGQGTIEIVAAPGVESDSLAFSVWREALRGQLTQLGYQVVGTGGAQLAQVSLNHLVAEGEQRRSPVNVGVGGSTGSYGSGVGMGVGINLNSLAGPPPERIERALAVSIRAAEGGPNLWEGRARMTATSNSDFAADMAAAPRILGALFAGFPGTSGETITVE